MNEYKSIAGMMPSWLKTALLSVDEAAMARCTEIRIRASGPIRLRYLGGHREVIPLCGSRGPSQKDIEQVVLHLCGYSVYFKAEELKKGYITLRGGHRMAVCGRKSDEVSAGIKDVTSLCIRIARQIKGCGKTVADTVLQGNSVLVMGEPGSGKTTVIRDTARIISQDPAVQSTIIIDEKSEIAPLLLRESNLNIDVLSDYPKTEAIAHSVRLLSPEYIFMDEITSCEELEAVSYALSLGIRCVASVHGLSRSSAFPLAQKAAELFGTVACMTGRGSPGTIKEMVKV